MCDLDFIIAQILSTMIVPSDKIEYILKYRPKYFIHLV